MHRYALITSLIAAPALVAAQTHSSGAIPLVDFGGQLRVRAESYNAAGFNDANSDAYVLTRILLNARVHPTASTTFFIEGMDARAPSKNTTPAGPPFRDNADLRQLYLQLGHDNASTQFRVGRQELLYGDGRLVGPLLWANTARTFDAARLSYSGRGYRVDAFASSV
ncbi:MAG TPA: alginate export family protein, partial [Gemmatimonadaceae bacterium]|nr:alginate export family protein [Gemmatimonadaceae bacterium]